MSEAALIEMMKRAFDGKSDPVSAIVESEADRGNKVVRPGDVSWLSADDWLPATVCSLSDGAARLVLIHAKVEGQGAFNRLLQAIAAAGLTPVVVDPTPELARTLSRRQWRARRVGTTLETREKIWYPRPGNEGAAVNTSHSDAGEA